MKPSYRFGEFDLDGRGYRLRRDASSIELPPKALDLLFLLAARAGALVSKDEILDALWPGVSVTDNAITQVVSELRQAFGDSPELGRASRGLFGLEYAMDACIGHDYAAIGRKDLDAASHMFEQAIARYPEHARSWLGLADVRYRQGRRGDTQAALSRGLDAIDALRTQGRASEAALASATAELVAARLGGAVNALENLLTISPVSSAGWTIPVEPAFAPLAPEPGFQTVLEKLADRAR